MKEVLLAIVFLGELTVCALLIWTSHWILGCCFFVFVLLNGVRFK